MKKHCEKYDAYYESKTGKWLEGKCSSKDCEYCSKRPEKHTSHQWAFVDKEEWCGKEQETAP